MRWVQHNVLARSSRPGYPLRDVNIEQVLKAIAEWKENDISSIICLLSPSQLTYYAQIEEGLLELYRNNGFTVVHIPVEDYKKPPLDEKELKEIEKAYHELQKPVLIHCSAGIDRTGFAVRYLKDKLKFD